jgi:outer membrane translocation and assembly module TamA
VTDLSLGYEQISSGGGGIRAALRLSYYLPIGKGLLALGGRTAAFITSSNVYDIPIDERYFNGGGTTVRSFGERELGPLYENEYPLGGLSRTVLNAEFVYPIFGDFKGAAFVDAGNVPADGSFFSTSDFRYGVGLGLRYNLPVGPIRLDYGVNPSPKEGEAMGAFHFSFGVAF